MTNSVEEIKKQLQALAAYLSQHREAILDAWREGVQNDEKLQDVSQWTRARFHDHIPFVLDAFQDKLASWPAADLPQQEAQQRAAADAHSRHRWQQGYDLRSLVREWGHLNQCMIGALNNYVAQDSESDQEMLRQAHDLWAQFLNECVSENVVEYHRLLQSEAAMRALELEQALEHVRALEAERGQTLRSAAHDLRGSLSVVMSSASLMEEAQMAKLSPAQRTEVQQLFQRGFGSLNEMLGDLMSMSRLEAGQEKRNVAPFDAGELLQLLCASSQPLAQKRGLYLHVEGPSKLLVEGDAVKVRRIVQNLLLNSLKYTRQGGVTVNWGQSEHAATMWEVCVEDSGPGLEGGTAAPLASTLQSATETAHDIQDDTLAAPQGEDAPAQSCPAATPPPAASAGEGVGLMIVKRLCELLNASIELQTSENVGSVFRIIFPRKYEI